MALNHSFPTPAPLFACLSVQKEIVKELLCLIALSAFSDSLVFLI